MRIPFLSLSRPLTWVLVAVVALVGLWGVSVPGLFTIDEANYMMTLHALQEGTLAVPDLTGLPPSVELLYMDPGAPFLSEVPEVLAPPAPPWYAWFALPFAAGGVRGLVFLNGVAALGVLLLVFERIRRLTGARSLGLLAMGVCAGGTYLADYALGIWPHALATLLCLGGYLLCLPLERGAERGPRWGWMAGLGGVLLGFAAGIRYQNIVFAALVLAIVLLTRADRWRRAGALVSGTALPLLGAAVMNGMRYGSWNPISKPGTGYTALHAFRVAGDGDWVAAMHDMVISFLSRVVDYALIYPRPIGFLPSHPPVHGIIVCGGVVKKAWLQSCPWLLAVAVVMLVGMRPLRLMQQRLTPRRREIAQLGVLMAGIIALFTLAGSGRFDGLCYNQRYFIELLPLAAMAFVLSCGALVRRHLGLFALSCGLVVLAVGAGLQLMPASAVLRQVLISKLPILLAVAAAVAVLLARYRRRARGVAVCLLGLTVGWAAGVHFLEELPTSRRMRQHQGSISRAMAAAVPATGAPVLLVAHWSFAMLAAPLELTHPGLVVVDPRMDQGADCPGLVSAALDSGRRVVVVLNDFPPEVYSRMVEGRATRWLARGDPAVGGIGILEIARVQTPPAAAVPVEEGVD